MSGATLNPQQAHAALDKIAETANALVEFLSERDTSLAEDVCALMLLLIAGHETGALAHPTVVADSVRDLLERGYIVQDDFRFVAQHSACPCCIKPEAQA